MRELGLVFAVFAAFGGLALGVGWVLGHGALELGWHAMIGIGSGAVLAELVYFAALRAALRRSGEVPPRWYARSFEHHHLVRGGWRWVVLPFFWLGFLGLLTALAISGVLLFAGLQTVFGG